MKSSTALVLATLTALLSGFLPSARAADARFQLCIDAAGHDRIRLPVTAELPLDGVGSVSRGWLPELIGQDGRARLAQLEEDGNGRARLHWVEPVVRSGDAPTLELTLREGNGAQSADGFRFQHGEGHRDLMFGERPVLRQVTVYDPENHQDTHKPYDHVHTPDGRALLTKGPGGLFPHHKGIFLGWNQTRAGDGRRFDFWHAPREHQRHREFTRSTAGPLLALSTSGTDWMTAEGEIVARDTRTVTAWRIADNELLLDYSIAIESAGGTLHLGGDAHHAGFQFRASQDVAENAGETRIIAPPGARAPEDGLWADASWMALNFSIRGKRYTVIHMDHPLRNPRPTVYSTRDYGRFGAFFTADVRENEPLVLEYRILVIEEDPPAAPEAIASRHIDFVAPPTVRVTPVRE